MRVSIDAPISFGAAQLDAGAHDGNRKSCSSKFASDGKSFELRKIRKIANSQASGRLVAYIANEMSRRKVVAVKFLLIGTFLFCNVHSRTN